MLRTRSSAQEIFLLCFDGLGWRRSFLRHFNEQRLVCVCVCIGGQSFYHHFYEECFYGSRVLIFRMVEVDDRENVRARGRGKLIGTKVVKKLLSIKASLMF